MDVVIAGAGLMGRLIGWQLRRRGATVRIHEKDPENAPTSAAHVAAAMLAPYSELPDADPAILGWALRSLQLWPAWLDELGVHSEMRGTLVVAHGGDRGLLVQFERTLAKRRLATRASVERTCPDRTSTGGAPVQRVRAADLEPELTGWFADALYLPGEGWLDNRALLAALRPLCGEIHFGSPIDFERRAPELRSGLVMLDCRGADAVEPGLRGVRGELIRVHAPEVNLTRPVRLMHPRYSLYVAPRPDRQYVIGATQIESDARGPVRIRSALELLSAAFSLHPGFAEAGILSFDAGIRAAFPDNRPRIRWRDGVLRVNGLYRHGYLVGPAVAEAAINEIYRTDMQDGYSSKGGR